MRSTQWLGVQWKELLWDLQWGAWLSSSGRRTLRSSAIQLGTETVYHPTTAMTDITAGLGVLRGWPLLCSTSNVCRWPGTWFFSRPSLPAKVAAAGIMSLQLYTFEGFCGIPNTDTLLYSVELFQCTRLVMNRSTDIVCTNACTYVTDGALLQPDKETICIFWHLVTSQTRPPVFVQVGRDHSHKPGVKHHWQLQIIVLYPICAYVYPVQTCDMRH